MRLLFVAFPGEGHVRPLLPLALAAQNAGHDVVFATGPDGVGIVAGLGLRPMQAGMSLADWRQQSIRRFAADGEPQSIEPGAAGTISAGREGWRRAQRAFALVYAPSMVDDVLGALGDQRPDVVVYDPAALAGAVVARTLNVPGAVHSYGVLRPVEALDAFDIAAAPLWEQFGIAAPKWVGLGEDIHLDPIPPSLQAPHHRLLPRSQHIRIVDRPTQHGQPKTPHVYVTFGTVHADVEMFRTVLAGVSKLGAQVTATVGRRIDPAQLRPQPTHVRVEQFIPQAEVLPRTSVAVCHAGSGSMLGALAAGVPLVMLPQGADQFWNAEATQRGGAGRMIEPSELSAESVADAVQTVLRDASYARRAGEISDEIAAMPAPSECVAYLEAHQIRGRDGSWA